MKRIFSLIFAMLLVLTACGGAATMENTYQQIIQRKTASKVLVELGYTNIYEFGGINTWPYEVE